MAEWLRRLIRDQGSRVRVLVTAHAICASPPLPVEVGVVAHILARGLMVEYKHARESNNRTYTEMVMNYIGGIPSRFQ